MRGPLVFFSKIDRADAWVERLTRASPGLEVIVAGHDFSGLERAHYALLWKPPRGALAAMPQLKCIFSLGAGVDHLIDDPEFPRHVPLARVVDPRLTSGMRDYVLWQVLNLHRRGPELAAQQRNGVWRELFYRPNEDVRVGVMGLGELGRASARALAALGFQVSGWSRSAKTVEGVRVYAGEAERDEFLSGVDVLVCLLPLTAETRGILDARALALLPKGACLINAGRGGHVVEEAVLAALDSGAIAHAVLDVFAEEPLPQGHRFWAHPRVTVTPHVASLTDPETTARTIGLSISRIEAGLPPLHPVDVTRGY